MLFIPLPFVVALLLLILLVAVIRRDDEGRDDAAPPNWPFLALILASAVQSVLAGLRWGYGVDQVGYFTPVIAAIVPPLVYGGVLRLIRTNRRSWPWRTSLHAIPAVLILLLMVVRRDAIDVALLLVFVGYAVAILRLMGPGADALRLAPFEGAIPAYRAIIFAAGALLLSAVFDTFVYFDFTWAHGDYALQAIEVGNLVTLAMLGIAAAAASRVRTTLEPVEAPQKPDPAEDEDKATIAAIDALMEAKQAYRDANLNLDRLARKAGIPARQISAAINRATAKNVSQYVNEYRIAEACRLLAETEKSVTEIMFEVGFQTKSNFNREFRRVTDMAPLAWREKNRAQA